MTPLKLIEINQPHPFLLDIEFYNSLVLAYRTQYKVRGKIKWAYQR